VASLAWEAGDALVLIDPLIPGEAAAELWPELDALVANHGKPVAVLITVFFHSRSADDVRERYGARVFGYERALDRIECEVTDPFELPADLPGGVVAHDAARADEVVYWIPPVGAVVAGDVLLGPPQGIRLCPPSWLGGEEGRARSRASLRRLLDLPVEMVLVSHGEPVLSGGRVALEEALALEN
jgi:glyoxylase-like metal-dependent hydrolase (beta-lactamase superfamily II)